MPLYIFMDIYLLYVPYNGTYNGKHIMQLGTCAVLIKLKI